MGFVGVAAVLVDHAAVEGLVVIALDRIVAPVGRGEPQRMVAIAERQILVEDAAVDVICAVDALVVVDVAALEAGEAAGNAGRRGFV